MTVPASWRQLIDYCRVEQRPWVTAEEALDMPWFDQARVIANGHPTMLLAWDIDQRIDFEYDARHGMSSASWPPVTTCRITQTLTLVRLFRGPH